MFPKPKRIQNRKVLDEIKGGRCLVCGTTDCDPAHIKTRGAGGDDVPSGVLALCRKHHCEQHAYGFSKFCARYPQVKWQLEERGWTLVNEFGVMKLRRK